MLFFLKLIKKDIYCDSWKENKVKELFSEVNPINW